MNEYEYWKHRQKLKYYQVVKTWLEELTGYESLLDVGSADTPVSQWGNFETRTAINKDFKPKLDGVNCIKCSWTKATEKADVITCLQVLEHFETEYLKKFVSKIFSSSKVSIISVPYLWRNGSCVYHKQDPINKTKFVDLVGREPQKIEIVNEQSCKRLVAMF